MSISIIDLKAVPEELKPAEAIMHNVDTLEQEGNNSATLDTKKERLKLASLLKEQGNETYRAFLKYLPPMELFEHLGLASYGRGTVNRYETVILPLCRNNKILFAGPSPRPGDAPEMIEALKEAKCYGYVGSVSQNEKLARNLIENLDLIADLKLDSDEIKQWKVVP